MGPIATSFYFSFFQLSYRFSAFGYIFLIIVSLCIGCKFMVLLCTALHPLLFRSFLLGPACRILLFILALNYIILLRHSKKKTKSNVTGVTKESRNAARLSPEILRPLTLTFAPEHRETCHRDFGPKDLNP